MIKGMTGFGTSEVFMGNIKGAVEIKTVNHRYVDFAYFLPIGMDSLEIKMKDFLLKHINRGRVNVVLRITQKPTKDVSFNRNVVSNYLKYAKQLKKEFNLSGEITLSQIVQMPGVVETRDFFLNPIELWPEVENALEKAISSVLNMRMREGKSLAKDISMQLNRMSLQLNKIKQRMKVVLREKKKTLSDDEFSSYQNGCDVNEEISRLGHHIFEIRALLKDSSPVGKKMDFIAQEMQRETNTIGSKLQDKIVSTAVIALKSKIEKIREQSQNVE